VGVRFKKWLKSVPAEIKLVSLCVLGIVSFSLPLHAVAVFVFTLIIIALLSDMDFHKIIKAQRVAIMYFVFLSALTVLERLKHLAEKNELPDIAVFRPDLLNIRLCLQIASAIMCGLLLYHTTTQLEIRKGIVNIEILVKKIFLCKKITPTFSHSLSLMLTFIPEILKTWKSLELAWTARGGKKGVKKLFKLLPILISLSMHKAYQTALAVMNR